MTDPNIPAEPVVLTVEADTVETVDPGPRASLIEYPSDFPIKIMGPAAEDFAQTIVDVVLRFDPGFDAATLEMRPSAKGNYLALTATVRATSREQLDDLYRALSSHPMVKVVL
jgi:putative lipoic acid-binding regulatory protein